MPDFLLRHPGRPRTAGELEARLRRTGSNSSYVNSLQGSIGACARQDKFPSYQIETRQRPQRRCSVTCAESLARPFEAGKPMGNKIGFAAIATRWKTFCELLNKCVVTGRASCYCPRWRLHDVSDSMKGSEISFQHLCDLQCTRRRCLRWENARWGDSPAGFLTHCGVVCCCTQWSGASTCT
jgi:hypothetical protein